MHWQLLEGRTQDTSWQNRSTVCKQFLLPRHQHRITVYDIRMQWSLQQYLAETWAVMVTNMALLEVKHHRWLCMTLHISWKDTFTNKSIQERTGREQL